MRFYLNTISQSSRLYVEVAPQINETFDESLDSATIILKASDNKLPYAPNQYFYITDDSDNVLYRMVLALDMVDIYSSKPLKYRHTLSLVQNTRNLAKNLVRNSVFSQPMDSVKKGYSAFVNWLIKADQQFMWDYYNSDPWIESININEQDVPYGDFTLKARIIGVKKNGSNPALFNASFSDIFENPSSTLRIKLYSGSNDTGIYYDLANSDLGKELRLTSFYSYIKEHPTGDYSLRIDYKPFVTKEWANNTITETTPTQFTLQLEYKLNVYYYNCYDLLNLLIERQQLKNNIYEKNALFKLPESGELYDLLVSTIPPNFTFTANTMYECIADIFRLFDAIFTLGEDNVLGIEYFNEYGSQDNTTPTAYRTSHAEEQFNRGLVNFYQDARVMERFPSSKGYAPARSSGLGIPTGTSEFCILLPHNIEYVDKCEMLNPTIKANNFYYFISGGTQSGLTDEDLTFLDNTVIDLATFIYEASMWGLLLKGDLTTRNNNQEKLQANCLYYEKGDNKINLGLTYQNGAINTTHYNFENVLAFAFYRCLGIRDKDDIQNLQGLSTDAYESNFVSIKTATTYMASVDGSLKIESVNPKYNGEMFIDQANGAVDLNKLGANMFGLALKLGEPMMTKTLRIVDFANRIRKGQYIVVDGEKWIANSITHTILDDGKTQSVVGFIKNYNAISLFTKLNQQKRMSTISSELVNKSEILFNEYLYFSSGYLAVANNTKINVNAFASLFSATFSNDETIKQVDYATIDGLNSEYHPYQFTDQDGTTKDTANLLIPLITYGAGNSLCFEATFNHPKSAGNKTTSVYGGWWIGTSYFTNFIPYTNENGFMDACNFNVYYKASESNLDNFPIVNPSGDSLIISIEDLVVKKTSNEIFALNYQLTMLPLYKDNEFVGREFINKNAAVSVGETKKKFYIYYSTDKYDILDLKGLGNRKPITSVAKHIENNYFYLEFAFDEILSDFNSWAICDEEGDIYFAFNHGTWSTTTARIYFYPRNQRIGVDELTYKYSVQVYINENIESVSLQLARGGSTYYNETLTSYLHKECQLNDTYSWSATAKFGYYVTNPSGSGTILDNVKIQPVAEKITYNLLGTSTNGTVKFYLTSAHISEITQAPYKTKVYWTITPDAGYNAPGTAQGNVIVDENNFNIVDTTASKTFDGCTPIDYPVTFTLTNGIARVYFRVDGGIWRYRESTDTISIPYNSEVEWYATPKTGCKIASDTPTSNAPASFNVPLNGTTKTANYTLITYTLSGTSTNGIVHFYFDSQHQTEIYSAPYGTTIYYEIEANPGYNPPSPSIGSLNVNSSNFTLDDTNETATKTFPACTLRTYTLNISKGTGIFSIVYSTNNGATWSTSYTSVSLSLIYGTQVYWYANIQPGYSPSSGTPSSEANAQYIYMNQDFNRAASATLDVLLGIYCSGKGSKNASVYVNTTTQYSVVVTNVQVYYSLLDKNIFSGSQTINGGGGSHTFTGTTNINIADGDSAVVTYTRNGVTYYITGYF